MKPRQFFTELKRRHVYKVAVVYAIVAWLIIQVASVSFLAFQAPPWVMKVFITAVLLGFPIALILAWAFELTPITSANRMPFRTRAPWRAPPLLRMDNKDVDLRGEKANPLPAETCPNCGRPLTRVGPKGECLRCLVNFRFVDEGELAEKSARRRLTPGPLKYGHFEVEIGPIK
jgi:hypothetical protein